MVFIELERNFVISFEVRHSVSDIMILGNLDILNTLDVLEALDVSVLDTS